MKQETKNKIVNVGSIVLTVGTGTLVSYVAGMGTIALVNTVFKEGLTKSQLRLFEGVTLTGSLGLGWLTCYETLPKFEGMLSEIMDIFPTTKEVSDD
jgi:hypothetical protein